MPEILHVVHHMIVSMFRSQPGLQQPLQNQHKFHAASVLSLFPALSQMASLAEPEMKFINVYADFFFCTVFGAKDGTSQKKTLLRGPETSPLKAQTAPQAEDTE